MYDFEGDIETIYTGDTDVKKTGLIEKYNHDTKLPQWTGSCANIQGASDGTKFPGYIEANDTLLFFRKSLCRSATMVSRNDFMSNIRFAGLGSMHFFNCMRRDNFKSIRCNMAHNSGIK